MISPNFSAASISRAKWKRVPIRFLMITVVFTGLVVMVAPYVWLFVNSLKSTEDFTQNPFSMIPQPLDFGAYQRAFTLGRIGIYLSNSFLYAICVTTVQLIIDSLAAFAFARMEFRGKKMLFGALLSTMMIPGAVTLIPVYLIVVKLGLANTRLGVMLPGFAGVFGIFMLRQFFLNIPRDLEDAARIDGCSTFGIYARIIMPLAKPALVTLGLFIFIGVWSDFLWPLIVVTDWNLYPISVGIASFRGESWIYWNSVFAGSIIASVPLIVLVIITQRFIIGGITLSGLKG